MALNKRIWVIFISLLVISTIQSTAAETRIYYDDWLVACRDDNYCSATAYDNPNPQNGTVADHILRIGRHSDGLFWEVSVSTVKTMPVEGATFVMEIDGENSEFSPPYGVGAFGAINDFFFTNDQATTLIDRMVLGTKARVGFEPENADYEWAEFSLKGLSASLLKIDEIQSRLGSERIAFAAPLYQTPVSSAFPAHMPRALWVTHANDQDCEDFAFQPHAHQLIQARLTQDKNLWMVPCTAGAYNFSYKAYIGAREDAGFSPIEFAEYRSWQGWVGTEFLVNPTWNRQDQILTSFNRARGLGDCGSIGQWQWTEQGLRMNEFREKPNCDGEGQPGAFPLIFSHPDR